MCARVCDAAQLLSHHVDGHVAASLSWQMRLVHVRSSSGAGTEVVLWFPSGTATQQGTAGTHGLVQVAFSLALQQLASPAVRGRRLRILARHGSSCLVAVLTGVR